MTSVPRKCRWCGCAEIARGGYPEINAGRQIRFECGSVWVEDIGWQQDRLRCGGDAGKLWKRISAALAAIEASPRFRLEQDGYGAYMKGASDGSWYDVIDVERAAVILEGRDK